MKQLRHLGLTAVEAIAALAILSAGLLIVLPALRENLDGRARASCANNMKQLGLALLMYANENDGRAPGNAWYHGPPLDCTADMPTQAPVEGGKISRFAYTMDLTAMYPEFVTDPELLVCPSDDDIGLKSIRNPVSNRVDLWFPCAAPCRGWSLADNSYTYLGHTLEGPPAIGVKPDGLLAFHPLPAEPRANFWAAALLAWDRQHPSNRVSSLTGTGPDVDIVLDFQFFAWQQVLGDTVLRGNEAHMDQLVKRGIGLGPPRSRLRREHDVDVSYAASINDGMPLETDGGPPIQNNAELDWSRALAIITDGEQTFAGTGDTHTMFPLFIQSRYGIDPPWRAVIMVETPSLSPRAQPHAKGTNVLFRDGHVEFVTSDSMAVRSHLTSDRVQWALRIVHHYQEYLASRPTGDPVLDAQCH